MRGEHAFWNLGWEPVAGSSPHARGALPATSSRWRATRDHPRMRGEHAGGEQVHAVVLGIIPACAGSTVMSTDPDLISTGSSPHARGAPPRRPGTCQSGGDHPRMRGEHLETIALLKKLEGIIPACAGSTNCSIAELTMVWGSSPHARGAQPRSCSRCAASRDHPRMRGEHGLADPYTLRVDGIIPACAGSTSPW